MGFKLPPLSSVRVFEAAARHGSLKKAAEELNITASAVSHAVQNLEDWLGVALFQRGGGKLGLTEPGAAYAVRGRRSVEGGRRSDRAASGTALARAACGQLRTRFCRPLAAAAIVAVHRALPG